MNINNGFCVYFVQEDVKILKQYGADGFVFGILQENGSINETACSQLLSLASPLPSTFHRAFDLVPDPESALETIVGLGFQRILTSGQSSSALSGISQIRTLVEKGKDRIVIMAGAGVSPENVEEILKGTEVREVHASCRIKIPSKMKAGHQKVSMGSTEDEMNIHVTDEKLVAAIVQQL